MRFGIPKSGLRSYSLPITTKSLRLSSIMPNLFNAIRLGIYGIILLFSAICLAMAGRFAAILAMTDLTRFVPGALFVCVASILMIVVLLGAGMLKGRNPINTQMEIGGVFLAGASFLILGVVLTILDSKDAEVECFSSPSSTTLLADSMADFHTEQYQAMYRVLTAFAMLNGIIALVSCFTMFLWARRRASKGDEHMWYAPITQCAWLDVYSHQKSRKPKADTRRQNIDNESQPQRQKSHSSKVQSNEFTALPGRYSEKGQGRPLRHGSKSSNKSHIDHEEVRKITGGGMGNPFRDRR